MAVDTPLVTRQRYLAAKVEPTTGTPIALSGTDAAHLVWDPKIKSDTQNHEREAPGSLTRLQSVPGAKHGTATFSIEVANTPTFALFMSACGCINTSGIITPKTNAGTTLTIGLYQAGRFKQIAGCQGSWKLKGSLGKPVMAEFTFRGKWVVPTSVAFPGVTLVPYTPPTLASCAMTVATTAYKFSEFDMESGNKVELRQDANDATGYHSAIVTDRDPVIKVDPEALLLSSQDWYAIHDAATAVAFSLKLSLKSGGSDVTGSIVTIAAAAAQLKKAPDDKDRSGVLADELSFGCTGLIDDEFSFTQA